MLEINLTVYDYSEGKGTKWLQELMINLIISSYIYNKKYNSLVSDKYVITRIVAPQPLLNREEIIIFIVF